MPSIHYLVKLNQFFNGGILKMTEVKYVEIRSTMTDILLYYM